MGDARFLTTEEKNGTVVQKYPKTCLELGGVPVLTLNRADSGDCLVVHKFPSGEYGYDVRVGGKLEALVFRKESESERLADDPYAAFAYINKRLVGPKGLALARELAPVFSPLGRNPGTRLIVRDMFNRLLDDEQKRLVIEYSVANTRMARRYCSYPSP